MDLVKDNEKQGQSLKFLYRYTAIWLAKRLQKTNITPNMVSFIALFFSFLAGIFLATGFRSYMVLGVFCLQITLLLDYLDGTLARMKNLKSYLGEWLDFLLDTCADFFMFSGLTIGIYRYTNDIRVFIIGFFAIGLHYMNWNINLLFKNFPFSKKYIKKEKKKTILKEIIYTRVFLFFIFFWAVIFNIIYPVYPLVTFYSAAYFLGQIYVFTKGVIENSK